MQNKNILIVGSNERFSIEKMYERAFKSLKYKTKLLHIYHIRKNLFHRFIWKYLRYFYFIYIRNKILNYIKVHNDFDLIIIFKGIYLKEDFINKIKKKSKNSKVINIFTDNPFNINYFKDISNDNLLKSIPEFDSLFIYSKKILLKLKKKYPKSNVIYLPFASDMKKYKKNLKKKFDLSFVGTADKERFNYINSLKDFKILLAGNGWERFNIPRNVKYIKSVDASNFAKTICKSKISLNILRKQNKKSHNMKTFEIPAMGGLMLTEKTSEQQYFFPENKACLMYRNLNDLKKKLKMVKKNYNKFNKIRTYGFKLSKRYTYKIRALFVLKKLFINV